MRECLSGVLEISELRGPDNFQDWEAKVKIHLERFGLEGFLNAAGLRELENDFEKKTLFYFRKLAAYLSLRHSIGPVIDEVKKDGRPDCRSEPHRLWEAIGKAIKRLSAQQASEFVQDLLSVDHDNYGSGWAYIHRLNYLVSRLQGMGVSVDEKVLQPLVLAGIKWWKPEWAQSFKEKLESGGGHLKHLVLKSNTWEAE
ncbi:hypothetical protein N0V88_002840 [Collariella sp. IMI 366227]|nr:hypothetical protein N0V88_002840 [Collariella sp. IMI 366227]